MPDDRPRAPLRTLVADPNLIARQLLCDELRADARFELVGAASHEAALLRELRHAHADVLVVDRALPPTGALATIRAVLALAPQVAIVVMSDVDDDAAAPEAALAALRTGATGYLDRGLHPIAIVEALAGLGRGELALSRRLTTQLLTRLVELPADASGLRPVSGPLSDREWEVLDLLDAGLSTAQIADQLFVSSETVRSHVKRILRKLKVHSRADAVAAARALRRLA